MDIKNAKYEVTAVKPEQYPDNDCPEIALVGRSNVGKSSIINALLGRKNLARVAATPGKTRVINFYNIDNALYFVDLPGYGYAKVSKTEKASWDEMIETYLQTRNQLQLVMMLVDIRHAPSKEDQLMYEWLRHQDKPHLVVASKLDKITRSQITARLNDIRTTLVMDETALLIPFSAVTRQGDDVIWNQIKTFIG